MLRQYKTLVRGLAAVFFGAIVRQATAQPFQNGDFESPQITFDQVPLNYTSRVGQAPISLPGWTSTTSVPSNPDTQNYVFNSSFDHVFSGSQAVLFNGDGAATTTLSQTFSTTPGTFYAVNFELSAQTNGINLATSSVSDAHLNLIATGGVSESFADPTTPNSNGVYPYLPEVYDFEATSASTTLTFSQSDGTSVSPLLDDVAVSQVPEPVSIGIIAVLAPIALGRRRRMH